MSPATHITVLAAVGMVLAPRPALGGDLGEALAYLDDNFGGDHTQGLEAYVERPDEGAVAMLNARDTTVGKPLEAYDCDDSPVDQKWVLRTNGNLRWNDRACHEVRFNRDSLKGYKTMGAVKLSHKKVERLIDAAAEKYGVSAVEIDTIIRFSSGYRPGLVKDDGSIGIMQIRPEYQRLFKGRNLLDPRENIDAGAALLRRLSDRYGTFELALIAFHSGPGMVKEAADWETVLDRDTFWFVRETRRIVKAFEAEFPVGTGVDSVEYVWRWLDTPSERGR